MSAAAALTIELLADGGIRVTTLDGATGLATWPAAGDWIAQANRAGAGVQLRGTIDAPLAAPVAAQVRRLASTLVETPSEPDGWPQGHSSLHTAASNGLTAQVIDLLERGVSPLVGRGWRTPYRLAMQHGHVDVLVALRNAGAAIPRGLAPPAVLPGAVVLRAYPPRRLWWLLAPFAVLTGLAVLDGAFLVAPLLVIVPLVGIGVVHLVFAATRCAVDGPLVARRRARRWQGPVDLRTLDALGYTPPGTVRMPVLWVLGQREAGEPPDVYATSAFDAENRAAMARIEGLRFVPLYAARGFGSPGFERLLARHLGQAVILGPLARERLDRARLDRGDRRP